MADGNFKKAFCSLVTYKTETVTEYYAAYMQSVSSGHTVNRTIRIKVEPSFFKVLNRIMEYQNLSIARLFDDAHVDRGVYYQLEKGLEIKRQSALKIVLALQLSYEESREFLEMNGIHLDNRNIADEIYSECVKNKYTVAMYEEILHNSNVHVETIETGK